MYVNDSLRNAYLTLKEKPTIILLFMVYVIIGFFLEVSYSILSTSLNNSELFLTGIIIIIIDFVFYPILASTYVMIAKQKFSGEKILLKKAFNDAKPFFKRAAGLFIITFLIGGIPVIPFLLGVVLILDSIMASYLILIAIASFIIFIILLVLIEVGLSQSITILMIENLGIIASIKKSYNKSLQSFWSIFEIELTIFLILLAFSLIAYLISGFSSILSPLIYIISLAIFYPIFLIAIPLFYFYSNQKPNPNKPEIGTSSVPPKVSQS